MRFSISADYELLLRVFSSVDLKIEYWDEFSVVMYSGGKSQESLEMRIQKMKEDYEIAGSKFRFPLRVLLMKNVRKLGQLNYFGLRGDEFE